MLLFVVYFFFYIKIFTNSKQHSSLSPAYCNEILHIKHFLNVPVIFYKRSKKFTFVSNIAMSYSCVVCNQDVQSCQYALECEQFSKCQHRLCKHMLFSNYFVYQFKKDFKRSWFKSIM